MAQVLLLTATPPEDQTDYNRAPFLALEESAGRRAFAQHALTKNPEDADLILFAEFYGGGFHFERIRSHPLVRRYREKCFVFCSNAFVIPFLPGVYASLERRWSSARTTGGFYVGMPPNEFTIFTPPADELPYLFSFMGSIANAPVRRELAKLSHPRAFFKNTENEFSRLLRCEFSQEERRDYYRRYAETTKATKFVLCPRGLGAGTIRLFETMRMGRVPVILSDDWVEPTGPDWEQFSIRIGERDARKIPHILEERESEAVEMGLRARAEWERWFSEKAAFHRVVDSCLAIKERRRIPEWLARWPVFLQYARPYHLRRLIRRTVTDIGGAAVETDVRRPGFATSEV